jgi:hypothetical protein
MLSLEYTFPDRTHNPRPALEQNTRIFSSIPLQPDLSLVVERNL